MRNVRRRGACALLPLLTWPLLPVASSHAQDPGAPRVQLREVVVAGRAQPLERERGPAAAGEVVYQPLRVSRGDFPLEFELGSEALSAVRLMTQLEGREAEWQDHDGTMWLVLRFLDQANRPTSSESFPRRGTSPGWTGVPQGSRFEHTVETTVVPEGASKVQLLLVSGGPPRTTGFWAVRDLRVAAARTPADPFVELYRMDPLRGDNLETPRGTPADWTRDGTGLAIPQVYTSRDGGANQPMLALADALPQNTGGWLLQGRAAIPVEPGMQLRFECDEKYSIGRGGDARVVYRTLPVGNYVFKVRTADEFGRPVGPELRLPVQVLPPFYATPWFRAGAVLVFLVGVAAIVRYVTWRKLQRQLRRLEAQRAIEEERTRLARDIHDEMGARLTQISILAHRLSPTVGAADGTHEVVRQIQVASRDLATALDEIVWAANPRLDTLESLGNYLSQYAGTTVRDAGLRCRLDIPPLLPDRNLSSGTRHRLMLAAKEAITNALKHAGATEIRLRLTVAGDRLEVAIEDNGRGFDPAAVKPRNGLENLRRRLEEMGGECELRAAPGQGTSVVLRLPLPVREERS